MKIIKRQISTQFKRKSNFEMFQNGAGYLGKRRFPDSKQKLKRINDH